MYVRQYAWNVARVTRKKDRGGYLVISMICTREEVVASAEKLSGANSAVQLQP